jgi:hypothetical protein
MVALAAFAAWAPGAGHQAVRAGSIVSTLDLPNDGTFPGEQVGAAIQIGPTPIDLTSVVFSQASFGPAPGESFAIFSRGADGTVGGRLFSAFALSSDGATGNTTATATAPFTFQAGASYWLMMLVEQPPGTEAFGDWDNSNSSSYTSLFGVSIPDTNASVAYFIDPDTNVPGYEYADRADGLQLFQVNGAAAVPEPSTLALVGTAAICGVLYGRGRRSRRSRAAEASRSAASTACVARRHPGPPA